MLFALVLKENLSEGTSNVLMQKRHSKIIYLTAGLF